jgi:hypothetical protein
MILLEKFESVQRLRLIRAVTQLQI